MSELKVKTNSLHLEIERLNQRIQELEELEQTYRTVVEVFKESEESFRTLAENSHDVIIRFNSEYQCLYVNPVFEKFTGIKPKLFIGHTLHEVGFPKDLATQVEEAIASVFESGQVHRLEQQFEGLDIDWLLMPESTADGRVKAVITSLRDISRIKQAQRAHRDSVRLKATQELARAIAHEFRQPLASLKLVADLMEEPSIASETALTQVQRIPDLVERMDNLVARMLNITQCSTKPYVLQLNMLDLETSTIQADGGIPDNGSAPESEQL